ncbi:MAG: pyruvate dehydrogenase [Chloroflexi bacterium]|nr:pyruvate dehydrogenase [Chloroflexota bacterium]
MAYGISDRRPLIDHGGDDSPLDRDTLLAEIQDRVLWLSMLTIFYANKIRKSPDGTKTGGHQASSASVVTILTSLFFDHMQLGDVIAIKPHASPVFHAIQFMLGNLDGEYLKKLREFHGLQAYPSRTKDPDRVDFSTGSVGLGAIAPNFASLAEQYVLSHFPKPSARPRRYISLVGDAELDEGSIWEAVAEPVLDGVENVLWVVDLNRQSLDRIVPGIRVQRWRQMFTANGWNVIDAKYGTRLQAAFAQPQGHLLRQCIDDMPNEVYQRLLRMPREALREWLPRWSRYSEDLRQFISQWDDHDLCALFQNLGGHDFATLRRAFSEADAAHHPTIVFAYTLKGWRLPIVGDPHNHSVIISQEDMDRLRAELGVPPHDIWSTLDKETPAGRLCLRTGERLRSEYGTPAAPPRLDIPPSLGLTYLGNMSTQEAFGLILRDIARELPAVSQRIVTASPDVATSTNLGGWINKVGVWDQTKKPPLPEDKTPRPLKWEESLLGQHIELGISENNLFMLLGQLGLTYETRGELLFPIGTLYDPFICRALEGLLYAAYFGARFIVVGTPSGITLSREGGGHQSVITPSIGVEIPDVSFFQPCFAQELEWILFFALEQIRERRESAYLRLSTRPIDQSLFLVPKDLTAKEHLRRQVLAGAYRLTDYRADPRYRPGEHVVHIFASGVMIPEAVEASRLLREEGVFTSVINVTSPDRLFRSFQQAAFSRAIAQGPSPPFLAGVIEPEERPAGIVTVLDGHPHTLAWIGGALGVPLFPLGVSRFGQSGARADLYREYQIDVPNIMAACFGVLEASASSRQ